MQEILTENLQKCRKLAYYYLKIIEKTLKNRYFQSISSSELSFSNSDSKLDKFL